VLALSTCYSFAQIRQDNRDTIPAAAPRLPVTSSSGADTSIILKFDTIRLSPDALEQELNYEAKDSMLFDIVAKQIHLYFQAKVVYGEVTIEADYIRIDWGKNIITAEGKKDTLGNWIGRPKFAEKAQNFSASKLDYNFQTFKGIIYEAQTTQEGMNVVGEKGKFIGAGKDTTRSNIIYNSNAIYSTCGLEHPHFGIKSKKQKIIADKMAIVGPSNLVVADIPTPLWLPFGFFPLKTGNRKGLIFPQEYEFSEAYGFGLEGVGWYFPLNDRIDLSLTTDIYMKGSVRVHAGSNYKKRYKYNGTANLSFAWLRTEILGEPKFEPSMSIRWSHSQDGKAHPYKNFGGSINIQTGNYQRRNQTDAQSVLQTSLSSNMSYRQRFDGPFDLSASFNHSQNTTTGDVTISFPNLNFQTQTLYPFKRKLSVGGQKWYEQIQFRYASEARNQFNAKDTTLFSQQTLKDAKFGIRHNVNAGTSFNLLRYFTVSPSANYREVWYFKTLDKKFDPTPVIEYDTIQNPSIGEPPLLIPDTVKYGQIIDQEQWRFKPLRQYDMGVSMSTRIFGTLQFKRGPIRGLRHVITPSFGFNFSPDYTNPDWGYFKSVRKDLRTDEELIYNIYENNRLGGFDMPSYSKRQMAMTYGFNNQFDAKIRTKKDTVDRKLPLFRSISVSGSYNFAADSMHWSPVFVSGNTSFLNGISNFRFSAMFDPYDMDPKTGIRINKLYKESKGFPIRLDNYNFGFNTNMTIGRIRDLIKGVNTDVRVATENPTIKQEELLDLFENFGIDHNFNVQRRYDATKGKDTLLVTTHTLSTSGNIKLSPFWSIRVGNFGYDIQAKRITYPDFGFERDLHCWHMGFYWQPFYGTYSFYLKVKPGQLEFINIPYRKNIQDIRR
jgi:hypothetical protein